MYHTAISPVTTELSPFKRTCIDCNWLNCYCFLAWAAQWMIAGNGTKLEGLPVRFGACACFSCAMHRKHKLAIDNVICIHDYDLCTCMHADKYAYMYTRPNLKCHWAEVAIPKWHSARPNGWHCTCWKTCISMLRNNTTCISSHRWSLSVNDRSTSQTNNCIHIVMSHDRLIGRLAIARRLLA